MSATAAILRGRPGQAGPAAGRETGARLYRRTARRLAVAIPLASLDGALVVAFILAWLLPVPGNGAQRLHWFRLNGIAFAAYMTGSILVGYVWCRQYVVRGLSWLLEDRPPTDPERAVALRLPAVEAGISGALWAGGALTFGLLDMGITARFGLDVALTIVLGGMSNAALDYLLVERLLRPVFAATFAFDDSTGSCRLRGVASRMVLTWAFTTGIPVLGVAAALFARGQRQLSAMVDPLYFLIAVALGCGMLGTWFVTRSLADPLGSLRRAMGQVAEGDTNVSVRVDDASEVGALQAGFNRMVAGLRERQLLQDLLGRQVGSEVARRAVERGIELGGESLDVAVFFVDVRNSTEITLRHSPAEVVAMLNRFFALVVDCVDRHGGWVNKFEGDAALCVFGAPLPNPDAAGAALGCARELQAALTEWGALQAAVGVAAGPVIAGNIGTESRFEYTVVGDPVNEAARLTDLAKSHPGRVLASLPTIELAADGERARWTAAGTALLRGRSSPTSLAVPTA